MKLFIFLLAISMTQTVFASENVSTTNAHTNHTLGVFGAVGTPFPTLTGMNVAYNLRPDIRLFFGGGENKFTTGLTFSNTGISTTTTTVSVMGGGAQYFMTDWGFKPNVGMTVSQVKFEGDGDVSIMGISKPGTILSAQAGFDWQSHSGYELGLGLQSALNVAASSIYLNSGWFF